MLKFRLLCTWPVRNDFPLLYNLNDKKSWIKFKTLFFLCPGAYFIDSSSQNQQRKPHNSYYSCFPPTPPITCSCVPGQDTEPPHGPHCPRLRGQTPWSHSASPQPGLMVMAASGRVSDIKLMLNQYLECNDLLCRPPIREELKAAAFSKIRSIPGYPSILYELEVQDFTSEIQWTIPCSSGPQLLSTGS